jgi:hypothetical protein
MNLRGQSPSDDPNLLHWWCEGVQQAPVTATVFENGIRALVLTAIIGLCLGWAWVACWIAWQALG